MLHNSINKHTENREDSQWGLGAGHLHLHEIWKPGGSFRNVFGAIPANGLDFAPLSVL